MWLPSERWGALPHNLGEVHHNFRKSTKVFDVLDIWLCYKRDILAVQRDMDNGYLMRLKATLENVDVKILKMTSSVDLGSIEIRDIAIHCLEELSQFDIRLVDTLLMRFNFDLCGGTKCVKQLFNAKNLVETLPLYTALGILFVARNFTISGYPEELIKAIINMLDIFYPGNMHIREINDTAILYNTVTPSVLSEERQMHGDCINLIPSLSNIDHLYTITGNGLYAFGHSLLAYENLSRITAMKALDQKHTIYLSKSTLANSALGLMIDYRSTQNLDIVDIFFQECELVKECYLEPLLLRHNNNSLIDDNLTNILRLNQWQDNVGMYNKVMEIDQDFWRASQVKLGVKLLEIDRPYVTLYLRDNAFKGEPSGNHLNSDRNANANDYIELINHIISLGYDVIRIGDKNQQQLGISIANYYEYNRSNYKNDLNDLYLLKNARFCLVGGIGGGASAGDLFCKPTFFIDYPLVRRGLFNPNAVHSPLIYYLNGEQLDIRDLLSLTLGGVHDATALEKNSIHFRIEKRDIIKEQITEFVECIQYVNFNDMFTEAFDEVLIDSKINNNRYPLLPAYIHFPMFIANCH